MSSQNERFGLRLKELRTQANLSQPQLAAKVGLSVRSISRLETGAQEATWPVVMSLCESLGVDCRAFTEEPSSDTEPQGRGRPKKEPAEEPVETEPKRPRGRPKKA